MEQKVVGRVVPIMKTNPAKQVVYGEVYVPNVRDAHGHWMAPETIESMAHGFMANIMKAGDGVIDTQHDREPNGAYPVESFVARAGDPDFTPGAWVLGVHVPDPQVWAQVEKGELGAYSIDALAELVPDEKGGEKTE